MTSEPSFRLLRAELSDGDNIYQEVELAPAQLDGSWTTLVTGRNGSGKSRLLSAVAATFQALDGHNPRQPLEFSMHYVLNGHDCEVHVAGKRVSTYLDGRVVDREALPRPRAVVAATVSAFDKFELPRVAELFGTRAVDLGPYRYLGLRDARGRISTRAGIYRALEQLFGATTLDNRQRSRIAEVFEYLGYNPHVDVEFGWTRRGREFLKAGEDGDFGYRTYLETERSSTPRSLRPTLPDYFFETQSPIEQLGRAADRFSELSQSGKIILRAGFSTSEWSDEAPFREAQQLIRARLLEMREVRLEKTSNHHSIDLEEASSGELSIATTFLGLASAIDDQSLILIDEPEINLHPAWQVEYLQRMTSAFNEFDSCHFILATHSPTLVSGADPGKSNIVDLEHPLDRDAAASKSADEVLVRTFGVAQEGNLYVRNLLVEALRLVADRNTTSTRFSETIRELNQVSEHLVPDSPVRELVEDLNQSGPMGRVR